MRSERERICDALIEVVAERGYDAAGVAAIAARAGIDETAYRRHFRDKRDCLEQVWAAMTQEVIDIVKGAYARESRWRDGLRAAAYAALRYMQADPVRTRFFLIEVLAGGEMVQARRDLMMEAFIDIVDGGRYELPEPESVPRAKAEALTGAIYENMIKTMQQKGVDGGDDLTPEMMYLAVLAYCGPEAAREELRRGPEDVERYRRGDL